MSAQVIHPKRIEARDFYLMTEARNAAKAFRVGGQKLSIAGPKAGSPLSPVGAVSSFTLPDNAQRKLGRKENVVEAVVSGIPEVVSRGHLETYLAKLRVPKDIRTRSAFFFAHVRRREVDPAKAGAMSLAKKHATKGADSFIVGIQSDAKKDVSKITAIKGDGHGAVVYPALDLLSQVLDTDDGNGGGAPAAVTTYPEDPTQDFAACYQGCLHNLPKWATMIVGGICAACVTTVGMSVSAAGADALASLGITTGGIIAICAGCASVVALILGNCFLTCHEMLGN